MELLADLVESPGWQVLAYKVLSPLIGEHTEAVIAAVTGHNITGAAQCVGRREGIIETLTVAYRESSVAMPDVLKARTKGAAA